MFHLLISSIHLALRHPPDIYIPMFELGRALLRLVLRVALHHTTKDRSGCVKTHLEYSNNLSKAAFVFSSGLCVQTDVACLMAMVGFSGDIRGPKQGEGGALCQRGCNLITTAR